MLETLSAHALIYTELQCCCCRSEYSFDEAFGSRTQKAAACVDPTRDSLLEDDLVADDDCLTLLDPKAGSKPVQVPVLLPDPKPAASPDAQADSASQVVIAPASNGPAPDSPVSSIPISNGPVVDSPAPNSPAPASTLQITYSAAMSLVVRVGLEGQQSWSQTICASAGMTVGTVWDQCAAYLGMKQTCCASAFCNGQTVSASDQTLAAFGSSDTAQLYFVVSPDGPHAMHLCMTDPSSSAVEAVFLRFEQASSALQRWAGALSLRFEDLLFLHGGRPINVMADFGDLGINSGDVVNVVTKDGATTAATSSSLSTLQTQVSTPLFFVHVTHRVACASNKSQCVSVAQ